MGHPHQSCLPTSVCELGPSTGSVPGSSPFCGWGTGPGGRAWPRVHGGSPQGPEPVAAALGVLKGKGPCQPSDLQSSAQTKGRAEGGAFPASRWGNNAPFCAFDLEAWPRCPSVTEQGHPVGPEWGCWGTQGACSCLAKLFMLHGAALLTQLIASPWSWDWGWRGVRRGRKLLESHKLGLWEGLPASSRILRRRTCTFGWGRTAE